MTIAEKIAKELALDGYIVDDDRKKVAEMIWDMLIADISDTIAKWLESK